MDSTVEYPTNTWEQVNVGDVFITYHPSQSRSPIPSYSAVHRKGYKTDPGAQWFYNGNKAFSGKKKESLERAKAWAGERYGIKNWRRNSCGDWIDADKKYLPLKRDVEKREEKAKK